MKYYKICKGEVDPECCRPSVKKESAWFNEQLSANKFLEIHELPVPLEVEDKNPPDDYLLSANKIVSKKAFDLLKKLNKNLTGFESQMYYKGEKIWDVYYTIVFPKYSILNLSKSVYKTMTSRKTGKEVFVGLEKIILDEKRLAKIKEDHFFAMEESPVYVYCTEIGKQAIEEAGLVGFDFEEVVVE